MRGKKVGIPYAQFYFPEKRMDQDAIQQLEQSIGLEQEQLKFIKNTGIEAVWDGVGLRAADLAVRAAKTLLEEQALDPKQIDLFIYIAPRASNYLMASEMAFVQNQLNLNSVFPFALSDLGCVTISSALLLVKQLIEKGSYASALIVTGSKPFAASRLHYPVTIIGDGGMALFISESVDNIILDGLLECNGRYWDLFSVDYRNIDEKYWRSNCKEMSTYLFKLALESRNKFDQLNTLLLTRNNLLKNQISFYIMQNISLSAFSFYAESLGIIIAPICQTNLAQYGHLGSIDIMLNYFSLLEAGYAKKEDRVLLMNNSPVAAWSTILIQP